MTEAAFFTIGQSRTIGYGKIRPLADYRSRSRLFILFLKFQTFILFVDLSFLGNELKIFQIRIAMKYEIKIKFAHVLKRLAPLCMSFF